MVEKQASAQVPPEGSQSTAKSSPEKAIVEEEKEAIGVGAESKENEESGPVIQAKAAD